MYASSWVWMPLRTKGREVCFASQGSVSFQFKLGEVPKKSCWPMPPPPGLLAEPDCTADVTGRVEPTFLDLSSCSRFPGTGASRVRQMNLILGARRLMRASMSSLFL